LDLGRAEEDNVTNTQEAMIISQTESSEQVSSEMKPNLPEWSMGTHEHIHNSDEEVSSDEEGTEKKQKLVTAQLKKAGGRK
jgi:transcriptional/translational regulatory protein YebC/TACO1